jgi:hypothetical protein
MIDLVGYQFSDEEGETLAEDLGFMVRLYSQSLSCMQSTEALLQLGQNVLVHLKKFLRDLLVVGI